MALVWHGDPFAISANRRLVAVRAGKGAKTVKRKAYVAAHASMVEAFGAQWSAEPLAGVVSVNIVTCWARKRGKAREGAGLGVGDVDATAKSVLDALQDAGVIFDDGQVQRIVAEKRHDPSSPRVEVTVCRWDGDA